MKPASILLLCMMLLIQGIGQVNAAQRMSAEATDVYALTMADMPCHEVMDNMDAQTTMDDCCDQDCQCHFMASALLLSAFQWRAVRASYLLIQDTQSSLSSIPASLYRPPIFA